MNKRYFLFSIILFIMLISACLNNSPTVAETSTVPITVIPDKKNESVTPTKEQVTINVTFDGEQCIYRGPENVPAGRINIFLDVRDQTDYDEYGLIALTVDEGKTRGRPF